MGASGGAGPNPETSLTLACSGLCCTTDDKAYQPTDTHSCELGVQREALPGAVVQAFCMAKCMYD